MERVLYELSEDKEKLLVTNLSIRENRLKEYREKFLNRNSPYWKLYKLETSIDFTDFPVNKDLTISHSSYDEMESIDSLTLPRNYMRITEASIDTFFEKTRQDEIIHSYINLYDKDLAKVPSFMFPVDQNLESYKIFSPMESLSPFLFGGEVYFYRDLLKIPAELQALDFFLIKNYRALIDSGLSFYFPWELVENEGVRILNSEILEEKDRGKQKEDLPYVTELLKTYKKSINQ